MNKLGNTVRRLAVAYLLICVHIMVLIHGHEANIVPGWLGYVLLLSVWNDLYYDERESRLVPAAALVLSAINWITGLLGHGVTVIQIAYLVFAVKDIWDVFHHLGHTAEKSGLSDWIRKLHLTGDLYLLFTVLFYVTEIFHLEKAVKLLSYALMAVSVYGLLNMFSYASKLNKARKE